MKDREHSYAGCNASKQVLHKRVVCCIDCHHWDELDDWDGYEYRLPDGHVVSVCCEVAQALEPLYLKDYIT